MTLIQQTDKKIQLFSIKMLHCVHCVHSVLAANVIFEFSFDFPFKHCMLHSNFFYLGYFIIWTESLSIIKTLTLTPIFKISRITLSLTD